MGVIYGLSWSQPSTKPVHEYHLSLLCPIFLGVMYLVLATFASLWTDQYRMSVGIGGLNYIALGLGFSLGTQVCIIESCF